MLGKAPSEIGGLLDIAKMSAAGRGAASGACRGAAGQGWPLGDLRPGWKPGRETRHAPSTPSPEATASAGKPRGDRAIRGRSGVGVDPLGIRLGPGYDTADTLDEHHDVGDRPITDSPRLTDGLSDRFDLGAIGRDQRVLLDRDRRKHHLALEVPDDLLEQSKSRDLLAPYPARGRPKTPKMDPILRQVDRGRARHEEPSRELKDATQVAEHFC